jgi:hypothetical protein
MKRRLVVKCPLGDDRHLIRGHGANGMDRRTAANPSGGFQIRDALGPPMRVTIAKPPLNRYKRGPESPGEITGIEQGHANADLGRSSDQGVSHCVPIPVWSPVNVMVQIVELADAGDPGKCHLCEGRPRERVVRLRIEACCDLVHRLTPGPEGSSPRVGAATQCPVKAV